MTLSCMRSVITDIYEATGEPPAEIVLRRGSFLALCTELHKHGLREEWRPGLFCDEDSAIDAGLRTIEIETGHGVVKVRCAEPIYRSDLPP